VSTKPHIEPCLQLVESSPQQPRALLGTYINIILSSATRYTKYTFFHTDNLKLPLEGYYWAI
jgi:hypothetical protein